jgi:hypothetical protein
MGEHKRNPRAIARDEERRKKLAAASTGIAPDRDLVIVEVEGGDFEHIDDGNDPERFHE